jgi:hypothetical protein
MILIDGQELADLMIEHGVGVRSYRTVEFKRPDEDFFGEERGERELSFADPRPSARFPAAFMRIPGYVEDGARGDPETGSRQIEDTSEKDEAKLER